MAGRAKPPRDPSGKHVRLYNTMLDSPAYRALGWSSRALLVDLRASLTATNNGNISATLTTLKHRGWKSPATLANALFELQALGFIAKTRGGGVEYGSKVCSLYRFTDRECFEFPKLGILHHKETHDYARFSSLAEAEDRVPGRGVRSVSRSGRRVIVSSLAGARVRLRPQAG